MPPIPRDPVERLVGRCMKGGSVFTKKMTEKEGISKNYCEKMGIFWHYHTSGTLYFGEIFGEGSCSCGKRFVKRSEMEKHIITHNTVCLDTEK